MAINTGKQQRYFPNEMISLSNFRYKKLPQNKLKTVDCLKNGSKIIGIHFRTAKICLTLKGFGTNAPTEAR